MAEMHRNKPAKKLYLDGVLVSEYYDSLNPKNWGTAEVGDNTLILDGKRYDGVSSASYHEDDTWIISFTTHKP